MNKIYSLFSSVLCCMPVFSQTAIDEKYLEINFNTMTDMGQELSIRKSNASLFAPDTYSCNYTRREETYFLTFTINDAGKPDGVFTAEGRFRTFVRNGIIYRHEYYQEDHQQLAEERFMRGDTIVNKMYNRHKQLRYECWNLRGKTIYEYECKCDDETDSLETCVLDDDINGLYIEYRKDGTMASKLIRKNLQEGVVRQSEDYDEKGKLAVTLVEYENGQRKTTYANGEYLMSTARTDGDHIERYTKSGRLIEKYTLLYPTAR